MGLMPNKIKTDPHDFKPFSLRVYKKCLTVQLSGSPLAFDPFNGPLFLLLSIGVESVLVFFQGGYAACGIKKVFLEVCHGVYPVCAFNA